MDGIIKFIQNNNDIILLALIMISIVLFFLNCYNQIRISKLKKKYNILLSGVDSINLEDMLFEHLEEVKTVKEQLRNVDKTCNNLDKRLKLTLQNTGMIRYNAFDDMGSDLSFSLALLDDNLDGVVISSLYGRDGCSMYGKPIKNCKTKYTLSKEELEAIKIAVNNRDMR